MSALLPTRVEGDQSREEMEAMIADLTRTLSSQHGNVTHSQLPRGTPNGIVICISDLHAHVDVQRNTAAIIGHLGSRFGFRLICVEGASGEGDVSLLWSLPVRTRLNFCRQLFSRAYLTGSEFAVTARPELGLQLWGVDVPSLYRIQWRALKQNLRNRPALTVPLLDSHRKLRRLYRPLVSPDLVTLIRLRYPSDDAWRSLEDKCDQIIAVARRRGVAMPARLTEELSQWRRAGDQDATSKRRAQIELNTWLEGESKSLVSALSPEATGMADDFRLAAWLETVEPDADQLVKRLVSAESLLADVPEKQRRRVKQAYSTFRKSLAAMPEHLRGAYQTSVTLPASLIVREEVLDGLWNVVAEALCNTEADTLALRLESTYAWATRFLSLHLHAGESLHLMAPVAKVDPGGRVTWVPARQALCDQVNADIRRINAIGSEVGRPPMPCDLLVALESFWSASETFYAVARQRSTAMARNIAAIMSGRGFARSIAVSGGFHSRDIADWLAHESNIATVIISPSVGDSTSAMRNAEIQHTRRGLEEE